VKNLHYIHNAYDIATALRYKDDNRDRRRQHCNHFKEFLVESEIYADNYRILATFNEDRLERLVSLSILRLQVEVIVSSDFLQSTIVSRLTQKLEDEVYSCTEEKGN
jgi:hypothetical protein